MSAIERPDLLGLLRKQSEILQECPTLGNPHLEDEICKVAQGALQDLLKFQIPNFQRTLEGNLLSYSEASQASFLAWDALGAAIEKNGEDGGEKNIFPDKISHDEHWLPLLVNYLPSPFHASSEEETSCSTERSETLLKEELSRRGTRSVVTHTPSLSQSDFQPSAYSKQNLRCSVL